MLPNIRPVFRLFTAIADADPVGDDSLKKLLMSWYYAGYYTGLFEGQRQAQQQDKGNS